MSSPVNISDLAIDRSQPSGTPLGSGRHLFVRYILPAILIAVFLAILLWALRDAVLPARSVSVVPVHVTRSSMAAEGDSLFSAAGWVEPRPTSIRVAALSPGVVDKLLVVEDHAVKAGEPIALLIDRDARLALKLAEADSELRLAEFEQAQADLEAAQVHFDRPVVLQAALAAAEAEAAETTIELEKLPFDRKQAEARLSFLRETFARKSAAKDVVSGRALDEARSQMLAAAAQVDQFTGRQRSLQEQLQALQRRAAALQEQLEFKTELKRALGQATSQVKAATARVDQAKAALERAQLDLDRMTVRAPVAGRILSIIAQPGARLLAGRGHAEGHDASTVVTMYQPHKLQIRVDVRFEDLSQVQPGAAARIECPALQRPIRGKVLFLGSLADIQKNTLQVKVAIEEPADVLKPDMLVNVTFIAPPREESAADPSEDFRMFVPTQLLVDDPQGPYVWIANQAERVARRRSVTTGRRGSKSMIEVAKGLTVTSRLIVGPYDGFEDNMRIRVVGEDPTLGTGGFEADP